MNKEIACILDDCIQKLQKKEIRSYSEIPKEYHNDQDIMRITRKLGLRKTTKCGYDIITKLFFAEELIIVTDYAQELIDKKIVNTFFDFQSYFEFLQGDIYENSCYFQYDFTADIINQFQLDVDRLNVYPALSCTVDDLLPEVSSDEKEEFDEIESQLPLRKKWIKKYNACTTYKELASVNRKHEASNDRTDEEFYIWNYINHHGEESFNVIMQFICTGQYPAYRFEKALCFLFGVDRVLNAYNYTGGVTSTNKKHNSQFKRMVQEIATAKITTKTSKYFDKYTHYYCVKTSIYLDADLSKRPIAELYRYIETFDEFAEFLGNDLSDCDLSKAAKLRTDFSSFKINSTTKLPINTLSNLNWYERYLQYLSEQAENVPEEQIPYNKDDFLKDVFLTEEEYAELVNLLIYKKNVILQGAPGVGKTFLAKRLAYSIMGYISKHHVEMVQFHQNYSYEDFIMGYKPAGDSFDLQEGVFYRFCKRAEGKPSEKFFFIIDEINRGNLSKIFGELMLLIEHDKRNEQVTLAYRNEKFNVPENVYIIGMMNTADRSLALMDYALRRRFSFFEVIPAFRRQKFVDHLNALIGDSGIVKMLNDRLFALNEIIADEDKSGLGRGFCIGHSYFCSKPVDGQTPDQWYKAIVKYEISPLLDEYWWDDKDKANECKKELLGE